MWCTVFNAIVDKFSMLPAQEAVEVQNVVLAVNLPPKVIRYKHKTSLRRNVDTLFSYLFPLQYVFTESIQKQSEI